MEEDQGVMLYAVLGYLVPLVAVVFLVLAVWLFLPRSDGSRSIIGGSLLVALAALLIALTGVGWGWWSFGV